MKNILFVDDNELLCNVTCDILRAEEYHAVPAYSAAKALEIFAREDFDIVVTDFRMAGMDGLQLARAIHDRNAHVPVIMVTAYGPIKDDHIRTCLPKEELFPRLLEKIRFCLSEAEAEPAIPERRR